MRLRELVPADAAWCAGLEPVLFPGETPWSRDVFLDHFARDYTRYVGIEVEGELAGYAGIALLGPPDAVECEILTIGTHPRFQRRGIGAALMDHICQVADEHDAPIYLDVRVGNDAAIALYQRYGFTQIGLRRNYYQPSGADAYTMFRDRRAHRGSREHSEGEQQ